MKTRRIVALAMAFGVVLAVSGAGQQSAEQLYKSGVYEEQVAGDLQKAIGIFQDILKKYPDNRSVAALAQLHVGLCYEKLGTREAEKAYQQVIDKYPEQAQAVKEAREKLSLLLKARAPEKARPAEFSLRQVWAGPEVDTEGSVTLDGRYLSFVDLETGDLAVRDLLSGTSRRLTKIEQPWSEFAMLSKWSRDGRRIAYQWYGKDDIIELRVMDLTDSSVRTIHRSNDPGDWAQAFDWTPDGRRVLAAFYLDVTPTQGRGTRVGFVSVEDGTIEMIKGHFEILRGTSSLPQGFIISPDGRFVAYDAPRTDEDSATRDIFLIALESGTESPLVDHPENDRVIAWTPDGNGLLFSSNRTGSPDLWLQPMSGGTASSGPRMLKSGFGATGTLGITARGDLYYGSGGNETDVYVVDVGPEQGEGRPTIKKLALLNQGRNQFPDYSPDGRMMAYLTTPLGRGRIISIFSQDTGRFRELTLRVPSFVFARWIPPDGQALSVWGIEKDGRRVIYKVDSQTGESIPIVQMDSGLAYRDVNIWAKDGKRIFYTAGLRSDEKRYVYVYDLETGKHERLRGSPEDACFIAVSPDGKWLAFINEHGKKSLRIMPASGGEPREVHSFEHQDGVITPAWNADGRSIYVPKVRDAQKNIWDLFRVPLDGGDVERIDLGFLWVRYLTVSPDGRHIAFSSSGTERKPSEVWVMENFLPPGPADQGGVPGAAHESTGLVFRKLDVADAGHSHQARLSPDGRKFLYVGYQEKAPQYNLRVLDLASGKAQTLVEDFNADAGTILFEWSPDGRKVVYVVGRGELRLVDAAGGKPEFLWASPDKETFARPLDWSGQNHSLLISLINDRDHTVRLAVLPEGGGTPRTVVAGSTDDLGYEMGQFSPDGKSFVGMRRKEKNVDVYVWKIETGEEIRITSHPAEDTYPHWSPDGAAIVFMSDRAKTSDLWTVPMAGSRPAGDPVRLQANIGKNKVPSDFTPSGSLTFYAMSSSGTPSDLFVLAVDPKTGEPNGTWGPFANYPSQASRWSPDGSRIAYTSRKGNVQLPNAYVGSGGGNEEMEIPARNYWMNDIEWSRDGKSLIFPGWNNDDVRPGIFRVSLSDLKVTPILGPEGPLGTDWKGAYINLRWLPLAGRYIVFRLLGEGREEIFWISPVDYRVERVGEKSGMGGFSIPSPDGLFLIAPNAKEKTLNLLSTKDDTVTLLGPLGGASLPTISWSPDGKRFVWNDGRWLKIHSVHDGTTRNLVESAPGKAFGAGGFMSGTPNTPFSPDGTKLAYVLQDEAAGPKRKSELWIVDTESGVSRKIADAPRSHPLLSEIVWHPSGKLIYANGQTAERASDLFEHWVLENFLPSKKDRK